MKKTEIIKEAFAAMEAQNWVKADNYFSEDFIFTGAVPEPISKTEWEKLHKALQKGIPDLKFNLHECRVENDTVYAKVRLTGTHTNQLEIPLPGIPSVEATNKKITMPEEDVEFSFKKDLISKMHVRPVLNGGLSGLVKQLGVDISDKARVI